jgi:hypothetical protein
MPANTVKVDRTTKYGNRYVVGGNPCLHVDSELHDVPDAETAVRMHREELEYWMARKPDEVRKLLEPLRGKNLACWCRIGAPCHADTLLMMSNVELTGSGQVHRPESSDRRERG